MAREYETLDFRFKCGVFSEETRAWFLSISRILKSFTNHSKVSVKTREAGPSFL